MASDVVKRYADAIRAECCGKDLYMGEDGFVHVCGMDEEGKVYEIGIVSQSLFFLKDKSAARAAISMVKFPLAYEERDDE